jgi:membrane protein implicated in regulation of membrane protease activity
VYLIAIAWMYVVVMMAVAEATGTGTVLGAFFTLVLYGLLPLGIVLYIFGTPGRRQMRRRRDAEEAALAEQAGAPGNSIEPDGRDHAAGLPVAPEGKEAGRL